MVVSLNTYPLCRPACPHKPTTSRWNRQRKPWDHQRRQRM